MNVYVIEKMNAWNPGKGWSILEIHFDEGYANWVMSRLLEKEQREVIGNMYKVTKHEALE